MKSFALRLNFNKNILPLSAKHITRKYYMLKISTSSELSKETLEEICQLSCHVRVLGFEDYSYRSGKANVISDLLSSLNKLEMFKCERTYFVDGDKSVKDVNILRPLKLQNLKSVILSASDMGVIRKINDCKEL